MLSKLYFGAGSALIVGFAATAFFGTEFRSAVRPVPAPGTALVASGLFRSSGSSGGRSSWWSSSTRSGGSVFGGK